MSSFVKNGLVIIGLIIVGSLGYYLYDLQSNSDTSYSETSEATGAKLAGEQFLSELKELEKFDLTAGLFEDPRFESLVDFTEPVSEFPTGRSNPFAPVQ